MYCAWLVNALVLTIFLNEQLVLLISMLSYEVHYTSFHHPPLQPPGCLSSTRIMICGSSAQVEPEYIVEPAKD